MRLSSLSVLVFSILQAATVAHLPRAPLSVSGVVVTDDNGVLPVSGATVTLNDAAGEGVAHATVTDESGRFTFGNVPPGRYELSASKLAFLTSSLGALRPGGKGTPLTLLPGRKIADVVLKIWRGGVITGAVTDSDGEAQPDVMVSAFPYGTNGAVRSRPVARSITDDRGVYRIFGLMPGAYSVWALPARRSAAADRYAAVYYPGTTTATDAAAVAVEAGVDRTGIDLQLQAVRRVSIEGHVTGASGPSVRGLRIAGSLIWRANGVECQKVDVTAEGSLRVPGVSPGEYRIVLRGMTDEAGGASAVVHGVWFSSADVDVGLGGDDVEGLRLSLEPAVTMSGRVRLGERPSQWQRGNSGSVNVRLIPVGQSDPFAEVRTAVATDGGFAFRDLAPGKYTLSGRVLEQGRVDPRWTLKAASIDGTDALDAPVDIRAGDSPLTAVLTFTDQISTISGVVRTDGQSPFPVGQSLVSVFPADRTRWTVASRRVKHVRPDAQGRYQVLGLPPGEYAIAVTRGPEPDDLSDPAFLEALLAASSARVFLAEGEWKAQDIQIHGSR